MQKFEPYRFISAVCYSVLPNLFGDVARVPEKIGIQHIVETISNKPQPLTLCGMTHDEVIAAEEKNAAKATSTYMKRDNKREECKRCLDLYKQRPNSEYAKWVGGRR